jgi:thymidylate synthase ThyX
MLSTGDKKVLKNYVTNTEGPVFGYKNMPPVVVGTLFGRYSRSELGARELLLKDFINNDEFKEIGESLTSQDSAVNAEKAEAFYSRVLDQYGDDSVAELGGTSLSVESISNVLAKLIEDRRIGLSPLEKSSRYVMFDQKDDSGHYNYFIDPDVESAGLGTEYRKVMDLLFETYSQSIPVLMEALKEKFPQKEGQSDNAYSKALRAQACDVARYLLPMCTKTNIGLTGNGRAFEYLVYQLRSSKLKEAQDFADMIQIELEKIIPAFLRRAKGEIGKGHVDYLQARTDLVNSLSKNVHKHVSDEPSVKLIDFDADGESKVLAALIYENSGKDFTECTVLAKENPDLLNHFMDLSVDLRKHRTHKPPRAFEHTYYQFEIKCDIGAYRDLHRHRVLTQQRQPFTTDLGYVIPEDIVRAGLKDKYCHALDSAKLLHDKLISKLPTQAQYVVPFGYLIRFTMRFNAREAYHLSELRSTIQGHPSYRFVAQEIAKEITKVHPKLGSAMMVTWDGYDEMARAASEERLEKLSHKK